MINVSSGIKFQERTALIVLGTRILKIFMNDRAGGKFIVVRLRRNYHLNILFTYAITPFNENQFSTKCAKEMRSFGKLASDDWIDLYILL